MKLGDMDDSFDREEESKLESSKYLTDNLHEREIRGEITDRTIEKHAKIVNDMSQPNYGTQ